METNSHGRSNALLVDIKRSTKAERKSYCVQRVLRATRTLLTAYIIVEIFPRTLGIRRGNTRTIIYSDKHRITLKTRYGYNTFFSAFDRASRYVSFPPYSKDRTSILSRRISLSSIVSYKNVLTLSSSLDDESFVPR